ERSAARHREPRRRRAPRARLLRPRADRPDHRVDLHRRRQARPRGPRARHHGVLGDDPARRAVLQRRGLRAACVAAPAGRSAAGPLRALARAVDGDGRRVVRGRAGVAGQGARRPGRAGVQQPAGGDPVTAGPGSLAWRPADHPARLAL
ncbi:MAG: hypothetical protein AVDCRST_MAG85-1612, partial [uncultured Solirubrobacteraceae bacterium]